MSSSLPDLDGAAVLVASDRHLLWRCVYPFVVGGALLAGVLITGDASAPLFEAALWFGAFLLVGLLRLAWWHLRLGARSVAATATHLVALEQDAPVRWIAWSELETLLVYASDNSPEWNGKKAKHWMLLHVEPEIRVQPESAFVGDFHNLLIGRRGERAAVAALRTVAKGHGVLVRYIE